MLPAMHMRHTVKSPCPGTAWHALSGRLTSPLLRRRCRARVQADLSCKGLGKHLALQTCVEKSREPDKPSAAQKLQARVHADLSARDRESPWQCSYALANMYRDGSEATGAHAGAALSSMHCAMSNAPVQACALRTPVSHCALHWDAVCEAYLPPLSALHAGGVTPRWKLLVSASLCVGATCIN